MRNAVWAVVATIALFPQVASPADAPHLARQLLEGCLQEPSEAATLALAQTVGASPYSEARTRHERPKPETTVVPDDSQPGEAQRTETSVTAFRGWDLAGPGAGSLEYSEDTSRVVQVELATGQPVGPAQMSRDSSCSVAAPVANGRAVFELYETLQRRDHGILVSADRKGVTVFVFDPDRYDIELNISLAEALPGLAPAAESSGNTRLVMPDAGPRFINDVTPGVPTVTMTRAALLTGLDHPAAMHFTNTSILPVVTRMTALP